MGIIKTSTTGQPVIATASGKEGFSSLPVFILFGCIDAVFAVTYFYSGYNTSSGFFCFFRSPYEQKNIHTPGNTFKLIITAIIALISLADTQRKR